MTNNNHMLPVGYMYKTVKAKPDWIKTHRVDDVYSVSCCVSTDFMDDWINQWKHNGYWLFNSAQDIEEIAKNNNISLKDMTLFFYCSYQYQWNELDKKWTNFEPDIAFETHIIMPDKAELQGYDVVSFIGENSAGCSPLSCNQMADKLIVNNHCLLNDFDETKAYIESGIFNSCEPGPYRILAVYRIM